MNPPFGLTQIQFVMIVIGAVAVALLAFFGGRAWVLRRRDARRVARVTAGAADFLRNVLVPDGNGGDYHLDFVLLTSRGVVIIDMRDFAGIVFGGDQMTAWTLMNGPQPHHLRESAGRASTTASRASRRSRRTRKRRSKAASCSPSAPSFRRACRVSP